MNTRPRYVSEYSRHHDPAIALGEALGGVVERIGPAPDLAIAFVSGAAAQALPQIADAINTLLCPTVLIGCTGQAIISGPEPDQRSGIAIWTGNPGPVLPVRAEAGNPLPKLANDQMFVGFQPAGNSSEVWLDDTGYGDGQVGFCLPKDRVSVAYAQGFRPIGEPLAVTELANGQISRLAAETAEVTMKGIIAGLTAEERVLAASGIALGVVRDEYSEDFGVGDFRMLGLRGTSAAGCLVGQDEALFREAVLLGSIVQFHVPDPGLASFDPGDLIQSGTRGRGALILAIAGQVLPNSRNFQDLGIGAMSGLVTAGNVLSLSELAGDTQRQHPDEHRSQGPAVVLFQ